jgi:hypothetical protein
MNLQGGSEGLRGGMDFLGLLKKSMHELTGVPETALGQMQSISNTSGVALSITYQPLMNKYNQKIIQYKRGIERVNELILLNLAVKEPQTFIWDETISDEIVGGQTWQLDPNDPLTYRSFVHFPPPLPLDKLIVLSEVQTKMSLGLESKEGALRALGEEFPGSKLQEIRQELIDDAKADGAIKLVQTAVENEIASLTGMLSGGIGGQPVPVNPAAGGNMMGGGVGPDGQPQQQMMPPMLDPIALQAEAAEQQLRAELVTKAYGTQLPQRRGRDDGEY